MKYLSGGRFQHHISRSWWDYTKTEEKGLYGLSPKQQTWHLRITCKAYPLFTSINQWTASIWKFLHVQQTTLINVIIYNLFMLCPFIFYIYFIIIDFITITVWKHGLPSKSCDRNLSHGQTRLRTTVVLPRIFSNGLSDLKATNISRF